MSKQLSVSAIFATLTMALFALSATPLVERFNETGAQAYAHAPEYGLSLPR